MDLESYYDLTRIVDVAIGPHGERAAFVAEEFDPDEDERRRSVFTVPTDGSREPHRLTRVADAGQPRWSPDGTTLGVVAARETDIARRVGRDGAESDEADDDPEGSNGSDGEEDPESQVWAFDLERGGDARQLTDREEGVRSFDWGPDGERIVIAARDPTEAQREYLEQREENGPIEIERLQHKQNGQGWLDSVITYLFVVDCTTGERTRLDDASDRSLGEAQSGLQPRWHPTEERIAFVANRTADPDDTYETDLHTIGADGTDRTRHTAGGLTVGRPRWSPDGDRLSFVGRDAVNWYIPSRAYVLDPADGTYRPVSDALDRPIAYAGAPEWIDEGTLIAPIGDEGLTRLVRLHADGGAPERTFDTQGRHRTIEQFGVGGDTVGVCLSDPQEGADLHAVDAGDLDGTGDPTRLTRVNDALLAERALPACHRLAVENPEGETIEALAYLPPDFDPTAPEPRPTLTKIHGGPIAYDEPGFGFEQSYWTDRGYIVLQVNYRGSSSYGRAFSERIRGAWGPMETADVIAGTEHLVERGWADPDRTFVTGFSYGGMTTAHAVTTTDTFAAAAAEHGVYDYRSAFGTDDSHKWWENDFGLPWERPEAYDRASSLTDIGAVDTPLLVTAGGADWRCPPSQAEQLYVSVKKQDVPARLVVYPDEHHAIGDPDRAIHRLEELTAWFEEYDPERDPAEG